MSIFESEMRFARHGVVPESPARMALAQPTSRLAPTRLVKLCYTLVHAAEAVGIRDLADGEFQPTDTTLEEGIERHQPTRRSRRESSGSSTIFSIRSVATIPAFACWRSAAVTDTC